MKNQNLLKTITPYLYLVPAFLLFAIFVFFPFGKTLYLSLHTTDPNGDVSFFNGFNNYINILTSANFMNSLKVTFKYAILIVAGSIFMGLVTALFANEKVVGMSIFRSIYALPMAISSASVAIVFTFIFHPSLGMLNYLLKTNIAWLIDIKYALMSVSIVTIWMNIGLNFIFILAALQSVDSSLYEAAAIDGAKFLRKHWSITLPSISPTLFFLLIINVINSFQAYAQINLMTKGGPGKATSVIVYEIYQEAFMNNRFGIACTESVILFVIILILTLLQFKLEKKVNY